jgi:hypothetical protein
MAELLAILIIAYAVKAMIQDSKTSWQAHRTRNPKKAGNRTGLRDLAYWLHQVAHGFPTARHGFMSGWHRGRNAHHQAMTAGARARAEHAEQRVKVGTDLAGYRQRRQDALAQLDEQHKRAMADAYKDLDEQKPPPDPDASPYTYQPPGPPAPWPDMDQHDPPDPDPGPANTSQQGDSTMGETNYAGVKTRMQQDMTTAEQQAADAKAAEAGAEQRVQEAEQAKTYAANTADEMQSLEVDGGTLGAMAEHLDALDAAKVAEQNLFEAVQAAHQAWQRVQESAQQVITAMDAGGHGNLAEAHADAAAGGAQKEFYTER